MMIFMWGVLPIIVIVLIAVFMYKKICNVIGYFAKGLPDKKKGMLKLIGVMVLLIPAIKLRGMWFVILLHYAAFLLAGDFVAFIIRKVHKKKPIPKMCTAIYKSTVIAVILTALVLTYGYNNIYNVIRTEYTVQANKQIRDEGYKIILISDLHYGISLDKEQLSEVVSRIDKEEPDMVLLAGDIVDESTTYEQMKEAFSVLSEVSNKYGIYYVYGNHDKNAYANRPNYTAGQLEDYIKKCNISILEDSVAEINNELVLIGRGDKGDFTNKRKNIVSLVQGLDANKQWVVIDHQPTDYEKIKEQGCDMVLSGHTHAGQIWPLGLFASLFHFDDMSYGYDIQDGLNEIVSSGIAGWGYPIRTEKHSEYVVINLMPYK